VLAVTAVVQLVCVFLVFATLIIAALTIHHRKGARALMIGYALGVGGYALGLVLSALFDLRSGRIFVWNLAAPATGSSLSRTVSPPEVTH
jgi:zinc/manganese transport system permease protein